METEKLIKTLSEKYEPTAPFAPRALAFWALMSGFFLALYLGLLPARADLGARLTSALYQAETTLFGALFLTISYVAYRSLIPGMLRGRDLWPAWIMLGLGVLLAFAHPGPWRGFAADLDREMDFYRGRCGPLLLLIGGLETVAGFWVARRAAPTRPLLTGALIGLCAGALGLFATQFICAHENFLHLVVWHFVPVVSLVGAAGLWGQRTLRW